MRFWDASALVPLCLEQASSNTALALLREDRHMTVWWGSLVECWSAFDQLRREGALDLRDEESARAGLNTLRESWAEVQPGEEVRLQAGRLLRVHPLRTPDALQLAAALAWAGSAPSRQFVSFGQRLREAALLEGLAPLP